MSTKSFSILELDVLRWAEARKIIPNGTPIGQAIKTCEEAVELLKAVNKNDTDGIKDGVGDVAVTLIILCALIDINFTACLEAAYEEIKDRKGTLGPDGIFYKEL